MDDGLCGVARCAAQCVCACVQVCMELEWNGKGIHTLVL